MKKIEINDRYIISGKIGKGSFGVVYRGHDKINGNIVAIKLEPITDYGLLEHERNIYEDIYQEGFATPRIYWYGHRGDFRILVMEHLGASLESLFQKCNRKFSLKTTLMIGVQMCDLIEGIHKKKYLHRDLKPENFLLGTGNNRNKLYIIDYGLAKRYKNDQNEHMRLVVGKKLTGTSRYASINSHDGIDLSRRDDFESLFYLLVYFYKGSLPWQGVPGKTKEEKYDNIAITKRGTNIIDLCEGLPEEFYYFIKHIKTLDFKEKPNYKYLKSLLFNVMKKQSLIFDFIYDWNEI
jgi:serine/threonine protein kinase